MKKLLTMFMAVLIVGCFVVAIAEANVVGKIVITTNKVNKNVTLNIKNTDSKKTHTVYLQLQKKSGNNWSNSGSKICKKVNPTKIVTYKKTLKKGTYRYKSTSSGKTSYTTTVTIK